jgi:acyl carrier protein
LETDRERVRVEFERYFQELKGTSRAVRPDDRLDLLGVDSLLAQELLASLEDNYGIDLMQDERLMKVRTVDDLLDVVEDHMHEAAGSA